MVSVRGSSPAPYAVIARPGETHTLTFGMRSAAGHHDDTAWVHVAPRTTADGYATLTKEILGACAVVGLRTPRATGDRHMARVLTHWMHGPVRHLILTEVLNVPTTVLAEVHEAALIAGVQLWLVIDATTQRGHIPWATEHATTLTATDMLDWWQARPADPGLCPALPAPWWWGPLTWAAPEDITCAVHSQRVECLLSSARRSNTRGELTPNLVRERLIALLETPDATVADCWAATAASRDLYTPARDLLSRLPRGAMHATIGDIHPAGGTVLARCGDVAVPPEQQAVLARQRTCRILCGCLPGEPILGVMDER